MSTAAAAGPAEIPDGAQRATVAAGCFWGVEHVYRKAFGNGGGLLDARVGYIGGESENPSYKEVCSGTTGREYIPSFIRIASNAVPLP
jgi:peptide-methionine (S)-S-oxide reductase